MKKNTEKKLKISKKTVATLNRSEMNEAKGGTRTSNLCTQTCSCQGGCTVTLTCATRNNAASCRCL